MKAVQFILALLLLSTRVSTVESREARYHDKLFNKTFVLRPIEPEVMIRFRDDVPHRRIADGLRDLGLVEVRRPNGRDRFGVYRIPSDADPQAMLARLRDADWVRSVDHPAIDHEGFTKYYVPDEVTVRFESDVPEDRALKIIHDLGCTVARKQWTPGYYTLRIGTESDLFEVVRAFIARDEVRFSEPSYCGFDDALFIPDDPNFSSQWPLRNTGQLGGTPGADIQATAAWDLEVGSANVILVDVDTGIDLDHPDLAANILPRDNEDWDFDDPDGSPDDFDGHGTATAGIAAAVFDNGIGVAGVAPGVRLMPLRVDLTSGANQNRADAINYAVSRRPEFEGMVISCSWRMSSGDFTAVEDACQNAWDNDVVILFASGNGNGAVDYPARYATTIAVGASSQCDERKSLTSCDGENFWGSNFGPELDIVAPGVDVYTTALGGGYQSGFNGTSAACPHAAGVAALILSANPNLTNSMVRTLLAMSSEDQVGPPNEDTPGWDQYMGFGRVNAFRAVTAASTPLDLQVAVVPVDTVVSQGDTLDFAITLDNLAATDALFEGWIDVFLPGGVPWSGDPLVGPIEMLVGPGGSFEHDVSLSVPSKTPVDAGYQLLVRTGYHPDVVAAEDGFGFEVTAP